LEISARNQLNGKVTDIKLGNVMAEVTLKVGDNEVVAAVTRASVERLGLKVGDQATAIIKATEVMIANRTRKLDSWVAWQQTVPVEREPFATDWEFRPVGPETVLFSRPPGGEGKVIGAGKSRAIARLLPAPITNLGWVVMPGCRC